MRVSGHGLSVHREVEEVVSLPVSLLLLLMLSLGSAPLGAEVLRDMATDM